MAGAQAAFARAEREEAEAVYHGTAQLAYPLKPLKEELPGTDVTLPLFKHLAAVIGAAPSLACSTLCLWRLGCRSASASLPELHCSPCLGSWRSRRVYR